MERILLKPTEAAEVIGLGRSKTYELISKGLIPSVRIGKSVRVPVAALHNWVEQQLREQQQLKGDSV
ncbi:MAG: excisionase family DNA-binding protein [Blastocatellia bacterium]